MDYIKYTVERDGLEMDRLTAKGRFHCLLSLQNTPERLDALSCIIAEYFSVCRQIYNLDLKWYEGESI